MEYKNNRKDRKINKEEIALIHVAKAKLKLTEDNYRDILSDFNVSTSKDLDIQQFNNLMKVFEKLGFKSTASMNYKASNRFVSDKASEDQIAMIRKLWYESEAVRSKTEEAFQSFVYRITKKISLNVLNHRDIVTVAKAIGELRVKS